MKILVTGVARKSMTFGASGPFQAMSNVRQADADAMLYRAFGAGINSIDTADTYSGGESERILGQGLKNLGKARDQVVIATKVVGYMGDGPNQQSSSHAHILDAAKASLKRLGMEHIDLNQLHWFDAAAPIEESLVALDDLVRQVHVRYVGVSNWAAWQIARAMGLSALHALSKFDSLEAYYSIAGRDLERDVVPMLASTRSARVA